MQVQPQPACRASQTQALQEVQEEPDDNVEAQQAEIENDNLNVSTIMEVQTPNVEGNAGSANSSAVASDRNILTSPQNTIGLPCSENREDSGPATNSENEQIMSNHIPPALPPRPINLQSPQVNGLPHPPHGFNASQGKFVVNGV